MNLPNLLKNLLAKNVELRVDGDKLHCRAPENVLTPELLAQIKQYKQEIICILSQSTDNAATYPLSQGQKALWFLYQLAPNSSAYNISYAAKLITNLDIPALKQATQALVERHPVLRTTFTTIDGESVQTVNQNQQVCFSIQEVSNWSQNDIRNWLEEESDRPFDLELGPIVRFHLLINHTTTDTLATKEHTLLITLHHIGVDFWSFEIIISELRTIYSAIAKGVERLLPVLNCQYRDYVKSSEQMLAGAQGERLWSYWSKQLSGELPVLNLPTDRPRPAIQTYNGASCFFAISDTLLQKLVELAKREGVSLYTIFLAALQVLLLRYTNQEDILIGCPMVNRNDSEFEKIVGYFTNPVVLRTDLSGNPTFQELLGRSRSCVLNALEHQEYPFPVLVERLQPVRDPSYSPLYQVAFAWDRSHQSEEMSITDSDGLIVESLIPGTKGAAFDLSLIILDVPGALKGTWNYNTDLFDADTIERMTGHFVTLLSGIVSNPTEHLAQLPLLTPLEQHQLLVDWNDTTADYPLDRCIHQLFESRVQRTPDAVAVVFENQQLTYEQLNCRANQLAHYLQSLGVKPDTLVGICVERSLEMVVGLLGILKAGGAYVPLDPEYPLERLSFMLEDSGTSVLLTQSFLLHQLPLANQQKPLNVICLDRENFNSAFIKNPSAQSTPDNLAYLLYTSGSTGQPKGVMIQHQAIVNLALAWAKTFQVQTQSRLLQFGSFSFDLSVGEIATSLVTGACLYLANKETLLPTQSLVDFLTEHKITHSFLSPSALSVLPKASLPDLQCLTVGGEACDASLVSQWGTHRRFYNCYGPTESTVTAACALVEPNGKKPTIGKPLSNIRIYILDEYLQPVPIGVPGELHIGGASLARGYLNRRELTLEKFIPNPFEKAPGSRLYKTGDLARYLPSGNIEYLGRIDNQVKIRGFRIELGEIEAVLSQHSDVQTSCVIARVDTLGDKRLVAYIVPRIDTTPTIEQLRQFLLGKLPDYMVPHAFVLLPSLPLTPNGKIDRRALPSPELDSTLLEKYVAPRTRIEEILALLWAQVLGVKQVGIHDNFFTLGGDSILSIQIISRAKQKGLQLTVKQLFANQTVASLAAVADTVETIEAEQGLVTGTLPLTPIQHWFFEQNLQQPHHFNQAFLLSVPSDLKPELLKQVFQQLLVHHDALRLRYTQFDRAWQQVHSDVVDNVAFSEIDLSALPENEQQTAIEAKAASLQASLNLDSNLVQVAFFHLGIDHRARLLIVIHHLVVDGVSWRILLEDLHSCYQQLAQGKAIALPAKTTSFKDWSYKLTELALSTTLKQEVNYWLNSSFACVGSIPVDYTHGANTVEAASIVTVSLNQAETRALLQDVPSSYNTQINDVLLTALVLVLAKWTNSSCMLFNLEGHGREDIIDGVDLSRTVGWFTTIFPVVIELPVINNPADVLKSVKEQLRAIPNKGIGYGILRYLSQDALIPAQLKALPTAQISFNYLGQFSQLLNTSSWMQLAGESAGVEHSLDNNRTHLLDINSIITGERLQIHWTYSTNFHQHATIENLAQEFVLTLQGLIAHCSSPLSGGYTPSDFELIKLSQAELDQLLASSAFKQGLNQTHWRNIEDIYPLSGMQQGMLFESLYAPESGVYFEQLSCTLSGSVDVRAFEQAWQQVVARHSILRTGFEWEELAQPLQVVYRQVDISLKTHDWQQLSAQEQQQQLELFLHSGRQVDFQLSVAPLMRLDLIELAADSYQFIWSSHHLLLDGWSMPLVFKDLLNFYQAISQGENLPVEPTQSYRNYIAWLHKQDHDKAQQFWKKKLQGFIAPTPMTVDKPLSNRKQQHSSYNSQQIQLTEQATLALQTFARQHQLTISNLVQATWAVLLCRYSQETDVVFGATVSGRPPSLIGVESMVGLFINTIPVRVKVSVETQVLDLLKDLQALAFESEQYSYTPLVEIQALSDVPNGTPLFESIVVFENYPVDSALQQNNYSFSIENIHAIEQTNYPLTVVAAVVGNQLLVKISYDTSRFDDAVIARMLGHFLSLLEGIVSNHYEQISQLPLLTPGEQQQLLLEWNDTTAEYPLDKCIHQLFESQVQRTPDAVAVVFVDERSEASRRVNQQLTYNELNCRANSLAHYLQSLGVKPDTLVGICVERSLEMVVGLLGILKAGGAYVPLDPEYPLERLSFMLEDAQIRVLLTQQHLVEKLPEHQANQVYLDNDPQEFTHVSEISLANQVKPSNLAYVLYTSGSTGRPKAVAIEHHSPVALVSWAQQVFTFEQLAGVLASTSICFDLSVFELFVTLSGGGKVILAQNALHLSTISTANRVTLINTVPSAIAQLIQENNLPKHVCTVNLAGEPLQNQLVQQIYQHSQVERVFNLYGPSEDTTYSTFSLVEKGRTSSPTIGRPIANTQIYILDEYLQPVPVGVPGELHIGGAGLARGYLNRPDLTTEKFIPNPFDNSKLQQQNSKLYKTGDKARYLPDGNIEYLGRIDNQVKIRGFRIELGEIEAVLSQYNDVQTCCVIVRENTTGDKRLVAYIVPRIDCTPLVEQLRQFLKAKLPEYMVPNTFVMLEEMPLTPNGKVDHRALRALDLHTNNSDTFVAPRNQLELQLTQIWSRILKVDKLGVQDNFFTLGGHSLLIPYLMAQIKQQFGKDIPLVSLYQNPTIEQFATVVQQGSDSESWSPLVAIVPNGSNPPLFCIPGAGAYPFYLYNLACCLGQDQPFYSFQANGFSEDKKSISQVEDIAAQYIQALQVVQPQGPYFLAGHSFGGKVVFEMAQQLLHKGHSIALVAILDTTAPFHQSKPIFDDWDNTRWLTEFAKVMETVYAKNLDICEDTLQSLGWNEQLKYVLERLKNADILPPDDEITQLNDLVQLFKADHQVDYLPQQVYPTQITLLRASETSVEEPTSHLPPEISQDLAWGWNKFCAEPVNVHFVPGNHITMMTQPHVQVLAERLKACIQQAQVNV